MRADRERLRAESIRQSDLFGSMFGLLVFGPISVILLGLYTWLSRTWMAVIGGIAFFIALINMLRWLHARRPLKTETPPKPISERENYTSVRYEDPQLGTLWFDDGWCFDLVVDGEQVTVTLEPSREPNEKGPSPEARVLWDKIRGDVEAHWRKIVDFTLAWANEEGNAGFKSEEFALRSIDITPDQPFCGGEVVYWFEVATDANGSYFVPVHDGTPEYVHRDS